MLYDIIILQYGHHAEGGLCSAWPTNPLVLRALLLNTMIISHSITGIAIITI